MEYEVFGGQVTPFTHESQVKEKPKLGCYIQGLYLEGAGWSEQTQMLRLQVLDRKYFMSGAWLLNVGYCTPQRPEFLSLTLPPTCFVHLLRSVLQNNFIKNERCCYKAPSLADIPEVSVPYWMWATEILQPGLYNRFFIDHHIHSTSKPWGKGGASLVRPWKPWENKHRVLFIFSS